MSSTAAATDTTTTTTTSTRRLTPSTFCPVGWYEDNMERLEAEIVGAYGFHPSTVHWTIGAMFYGNGIPHVEGTLEVFEERFKAFVKCEVYQQRFELIGWYLVREKMSDELDPRIAAQTGLGLDYVRRTMSRMINDTSVPKECAHVIGSAKHTAHFFKIGCAYAIANAPPVEIERMAEAKAERERQEAERKRLKVERRVYLKARQVSIALYPTPAKRKQPARTTITPTTKKTNTKKTNTKNTNTKNKKSKK
jgi:hypothetical protein